MKKICLFIFIAAICVSCKKEDAPDPIIPPPPPHKTYELIWSINRLNEPAGSSIPLTLYKDYVLYSQGNAFNKPQTLIAADLKTGIKAWEVQVEWDPNLVISQALGHFLYYKSSENGQTLLKQIDLDTRQIITLPFPTSHVFISWQIWSDGLLIRSTNAGMNKTLLFRPSDGLFRTLYEAPIIPNTNHQTGPLIAWTNQTGDTLLSTLEWIDATPAKSELRTVNISTGDTLYRIENDISGSWTTYPNKGLSFRNGNLYMFQIGTPPKVKCYNATTGNARWTFVSNSKVFEFPEKIDYEGNTALLFGGISKKMEAFDTDAGYALWSNPFPPLSNISGICTAPGQFLYTLAGGLYSIKSTTGEELWHFQSPYTAGLYPGFWLAPVYDETSKILVVLNDQDLVVGINLNP